MANVIVDAIALEGRREVGVRPRVHSPRLPLTAARGLAREVLALLEPACELIEIAGSIRRQRADVGDIEIVAIPRHERRPAGMFGDTRDADLLDERCDDLVARGTLAKRLNRLGHPAWGPLHKRAMYSGIPVDLFCATPGNWGVILTLRTGSAEFNLRLVTPRAKGGYAPGHLRLRGGWVTTGDGERIPTSTEVEFFRVWGLRWLDPRERDGQAPWRAVAAAE